MSDEQPPEVGSRRRRREIREARERERAAQRESESAVRRLSQSSTADTTTNGGRAVSSAGSGVFDQETTTPKDERRSRPAGSAQEFVSRRERRRLQAERAAQARTAGSAEPVSKQQEPERPAEKPRPGEQSPPETPPAAEPDPAPVTPSSPSTPFEEVVAPRSAESPETAHNEQVNLDEHHADYLPEDIELGWHGEFDEGHIDHDHDGSPILVGASGYGRGYQTLSPAEGQVDRELLKKRKVKRRRRNVTLTFALLGFAVLMIAFVMIVRSLLGESGVEDYDTIAGDEVEFEIRQGEGLSSIQTRLVDQEIVASSDAFQQAIGDLDEQPIYHPGPIEGMREQMPAADAVALLFPESAGIYYIAIDPNMWIDDTLERIADGTSFSLEELQELNDDPQQFGLPEQAENLEGYLPPGTYEFDIDEEPTAEQVLQHMVDITFDRLEDLDIDDPDEQYDTVIIASLITAEANHEAPEEYADMSSAIHNRLSPDNEETDGRLQIDATANYSMGAHDLHAAADADSDDPYNTRTNAGLPPGPIGAPLHATLEAAHEPSDTDYYYWVTVNIETGETWFSETYEEHQEGEELFLEWCEDNPGVCSPEEVDAAEDVVED